MAFTDGIDAHPVRSWHGFGAPTILIVDEYTHEKGAVLTIKLLQNPFDPIGHTLFFTIVAIVKVVIFSEWYSRMFLQ